MRETQSAVVDLLLPLVTRRVMRGVFTARFDFQPHIDKHYVHHDAARRADAALEITIGLLYHFAGQGIPVVNCGTIFILPGKHEQELIFRMKELCLVHLGEPTLTIR